MILCSPKPASLIKGALLAQLHGDLPCLKGKEHDLGLFGYTTAHDADNETVPALLAQLAVKSSIKAEWLRAEPGRILSRIISGNLRYQAPDQAALIFAAVEEALLRSHTYCLSGIGDISRVFIARYRAVSHEVHRMLGFIRFHSAPDNTLVTQPKLFHNTADIILRQFAPRYPGTRLVLVLPHAAMVLADGELSSLPPDTYAKYILNDPFTAAWEKYYNSQYIATRKNISLASRCIPKKYWNWLDEGRILNHEAKN